MTIFATSVAFASEESCSEIDLRNDQIHGRSEDLRQGSKGWCYAFAAAVSVSQVLGQEVSVMDIALHYNFNNIDKPMNQISASDLFNTHMGKVNFAVNDLVVKGFCQARRLPWNLDFALSQEGLTAEQAIDNVDQICGPRKKANWQMKGQEANGDFSVINDQLEQGLIPIISADDGLFFLASTGLSEMRNADHVVNIVGRKFNSKLKACEYIIRDSMRNQSIVPDLVSPRYENGYMYATEKQIEKYLKNIHFINLSNENQNQRGAHNVVK